MRLQLGRLERQAAAEPDALDGGGGGRAGRKRGAQLKMIAEPQREPRRAQPSGTPADADL